MAIMAITRDSGKSKDFAQKVSSTVVRHTFLFNNAGFAEKATSSSLIQLGCMVDQTTLLIPLPALCVQVDNTTEWLADVNTDTLQTMVGSSFDLLDEATVDNSGAGTQVTCTAVVGLTTDRQMIIRVNPSALA